MTLGVTSLIVAITFCWLASLPYTLAEELSMTPEEVEEISEPASRLLAKSKIPANIRQGFANSGDVVALSSACFAYVFRLFTILNPTPEALTHDNHVKTSRVQTSQPNTNGTGGQAAGATNGIVNAGNLASFGNFAAI